MIGPERGERVPALEAGFHDPEHQHHLPDRQRQRAGEVEAAARRAAALADDRVRHHGGGHPDRRVDQKHPAPGELLRDDPPEQHPRGAAEPVHRRPRADRAVELMAGGERGGDDRQRAGRHQRAADALRRAREHERLAVGGDAAGERGEPEHEQRHHEHPALPEVVGGAPAEHQEARERDRVGVDDPLQFGRGEAEARLDRGQRDVDDGEVEDHHELRHAAHSQQQPHAPARPAGLGRGWRRRHRAGGRLDAHDGRESGRKPASRARFARIRAGVVDRRGSPLRSGCRRRLVG